MVNCGGAWATKLAAMCGVIAPIITLKHAYIVTERIEGIENMPNVRDHDASVYLRLQGDALSIGGYEPNPIFCEVIILGITFVFCCSSWFLFCVVDVVVNWI